MSDEEPETRKIPRSSITGKWTSKEYARKHPDTTFWDTVTVSSRPANRESPRGDNGQFAKPEDVVLDDTPIEDVIQAYEREIGDPDLRRQEIRRKAMLATAEAIKVKDAPIEESEP